MKNTTFRKKALLSSVCMLLVALVALGSATFAWFTSSTVATANGIAVKTVKSSELVISSLNKSWDTTVEYGQTTAATYLPVSSANGSKWYSTSAADKTSFAADTTKEAEEVTKYYFAEQLNVKNKGEAAVNEVTITFAFKNAVKNDYIRVALVPVTDTEDNTSTLPSAATNFTTSIYDTEGEVYKALTGKNVTTDLSGDITAKKDLVVNVGTLDPGQAKFYNLYVWYEGQDEDCKDANAGASLADIEFTVQGTTAEQA